MVATIVKALWGFSTSKIKIAPPKNKRNTVTKKGVNINEKTKIKATLKPTRITHGDIPLLYKRIKKERKTNEDPKSGCKSISKAGPRNKAKEIANTLVLVTLVLKKLR